MRRLWPLLVFLLLLSGCGSSSSSRSYSASTSKRSAGEETGMRRVKDPYGQVQIRKKRTFTKKEERERKRPSEIPGLTKGQVADMPDVPALPAILGLHHTEEQLNAHAILQAREDVQGGRAALFTIDQRYAYIRYIWLDEWQQRKQLLREVAAEQADNARRIRHAAARNAAWERSNQQRRTEHERKMERIRQLELPVLTRDEIRTLRGM